MNRCLFCHAPRLHMELGAVLFLMFASAVLGFSVMALASIQPMPPAMQRIVCESGSFEAARAPHDPYLREQAVCNVNDANGRRVNVLVID